MAHHARSRRGLTLVEIMVVIAILLVLLAVIVPGVNSLFALQQRKAAKNLATLYERLHDEAVMRNATIRIIYYLNDDRYVVEAGDAYALIASGPEEREDFERQERLKLAAMDEDEKKEYRSRKRSHFNKLEDKQTEFELPRGVTFGGVYTPQYEEMVTPDPDWELDHEDEGELKVRSYIFANGVSEHTVIWLVDRKNPDDGWTIEVEPLSGRVRLHGELVDWRDSYDFVPEEGPDLPS